MPASMMGGQAHPARAEIIEKRSGQLDENEQSEHISENKEVVAGYATPLEQFTQPVEKAHYTNDHGQCDEQQDDGKYQVDGPGKELLDCDGC